MPTQGSWRPLVSDLGLAAVAVHRPARRQDASWSASPRSARRCAGRWRCRPGCRRRGWSRTRPGRPAMRISSAFSSPDSAAAAKPSPISTALDRVDAPSAPRRGRRRACRRSARRGRPARPSATTSITAPSEEPALRTSSSRLFPACGGAWRSGQKKGLSSTAVPVPAARSIGVRPICTSAPRMVDRRRPAPCARRRRRRPAWRSRARRSGRRRGSRGCRISAHRCSRRGRAGTGPGSRRSPCERWSCVLDQQRDRRAGGHALEHAGQDPRPRPAPGAGW